MKATDAYGRMECSDCKGWFDEIRLHSCFYRQERYREALKAISTVSQFDYPELGQIIGPEHYEEAMLDCCRIAQEALKGDKNG